MNKIKKKFLWIGAFLLIIMLIGRVFLKVTNSNIVDFTSLKENDLYFPILADIKEEKSSFDINANSIVFYGAVIDEEENPLANIEVVIKDIIGREIATLKTDEFGFFGISGLATSNTYYLSLGNNVETSYRIKYHFNTENSIDSTYQVVFAVTKKEYTSSDYDQLVESYKKKVFKNSSSISSMEFTKMHDSWNYLSGSYTFRQKDLIGTKLYINSKKHEYDNEDKTTTYLERRFTVSISDSQVLDYTIKAKEENKNITIIPKDNEIVVTNYDKKNITTYLGTLTVTFKKDGKIYKTSKTIDLLANLYSNSIIDMTVTKDKELLSGAIIRIERLPIGTSVSYLDKQEIVVEDSHFQINASSGVYRVTKIYQGEVLGTLVFTVRNNENQTIIF